MFANLKAEFTKGDILALNAFVDSLIGLYFLHLASITIVIILLSNFFIDKLLLVLNFFLPNFFDDFWRFFISTERAFDDSVVFELMLRPLGKAIQVKSIPANSCASCYCVTFYDLHMANGA